jgi:hypothetical protein
MPYSCIFEYCDVAPCQHSTFSTDVDYRDDFFDLLVDPERHREIWLLYHSPDGVSAEKAEEYAFELARCRRIRENWDRIQDDFRFNTSKYLEEKCGFKDTNIVYTPKKRKAMLELLKKKEQELMAVRHGATVPK